MPKINLKNSNTNSLIVLLKQFGINYTASRKQAQGGNL